MVTTAPVPWMSSLKQSTLLLILSRMAKACTSGFEIGQKHIGTIAQLLQVLRPPGLSAFLQ